MSVLEEPMIKHNQNGAMSVMAYFIIMLGSKSQEQSLDTKLAISFNEMCTSLHKYRSVQC